MRHKIELKHGQKLLIATTSGKASFEAFQALIGKLFEPPYVGLNYDVLVDNRKLNVRSLTRQEAEALADLLAQHMDEFSHLKHALVVKGVLSFGITRLFELRASSIHNLPMRVFMSYTEAMSWLRPGESAAQGGDSES
jgi:hypothetical protein